MEIQPITDANTKFELVRLQETHINGKTKLYPYCINHGAMNKVSSFTDTGGGFWRCCTTENLICRAGCIESKQ